MEDVRYKTLGGASIRHRVDEVCTQINATCIHLGHVKNGDDGTTLAPLHDFCIANPSKNVIYLHDKGSFSANWVNTLLRRDLLRGLSSKPCADAVEDDSCDVCSLRFSPAPHAHTPGNMWSARCEYVARLRSPREFRDLIDNGPKRTGCGPGGSWCGLGRYAHEHWVHSHPSLRACDVLDRSYHHSWPRNFPTPDFPIKFSMAPRYTKGHPWHQRSRGGPAFMLEEWNYLYKERPPPSSRLWKAYQGQL